MNILLKNFKNKGKMLEFPCKIRNTIKNAQFSNQLLEDSAIL